MRVSGYIVAILVLGLFFATFYGIVNDLASDSAYAVSIDDSYKNSFDKTTNITDQISNDYSTLFGDSTQNKTGAVVDKTSFLALVPEAVSLVKNMVKLPVQVGDDIITSVAENLGLPDFMVSFILTIIIIFILTAVLAIIMRYRYI